MPIPELEPHCGSWTILWPDKDEAIFETFERVTAEAAEAAGYRVVTTYQWLVMFNRRVRQEGGG